MDLTGNTKEFEHMQTDEVNIEVVGTFVDFCLAHFYASLNWRHKAYNTTITEIFIESNEVIAMLLLENDRDNFKKCYDMHRLLTRKEANSKYTKVDSNSEIFRGWHTKGIRRFNALVLIIKRHLNTEETKEMEIKLKSRYARICGKMGRRGGNVDSD